MNVTERENGTRRHGRGGQTKFVIRRQYEFAVLMDRPSRDNAASIVRRRVRSAGVV